MIVRELAGDNAFMLIKFADIDGKRYEAYVADESHHAMMVIRGKFEETMGTDWNPDNDSDSTFGRFFLRRDNENDGVMADAYYDWMQCAGKYVFVFKDAGLYVVGHLMSRFSGVRPPHEIEWYCPVPDGMTFVLAWTNGNVSAFMSSIEQELPGNVNRDKMIGSGNSHFLRSTMHFGYRMGGIPINELVTADISEMKVKAAEEFFGKPCSDGNAKWEVDAKWSWILDMLCTDWRIEVRRMLAMNRELNWARADRLAVDPDWRVRRDLLMSMTDEPRMYRMLTGLLRDPSEKVRFSAAVILLDPKAANNRNLMPGDLWDQTVKAFLVNGYEGDWFRPAIMARIMEA